MKYSPANEPLVISVATNAKLPNLLTFNTTAAYEFFVSLVQSFLSISLVQNALVTGLIVTKIVIVYRYISPKHAGYANGPTRGIVPVLIESGVMTFVAQLVQTLMFKFDNSAYPIIGRLVVMLFVRGFILNCLC